MILCHFLNLRNSLSLRPAAATRADIICFTAQNYTRPICRTTTQALPVVARFRPQPVFTPATPSLRMTKASIFSTIAMLQPSRTGRRTVRFDFEIAIDSVRRRVKKPGFLRSAYGAISCHKFKPKNMTDDIFLAQILGHKGPNAVRRAVLQVCSRGENLRR